MRSLILILALAGASPQPPTFYGFFDCSDLLGSCLARDDSAAAKQAVCMGYVAGAVDQAMMDQAARDPAMRTICAPTSLTLQAAVRDVIDHASWAATERGVGAAGLVRFALEQAYPCRAPGTGI